MNITASQARSISAAARPVNEASELEALIEAAANAGHRSILVRSLPEDAVLSDLWASGFNVTREVPNGAPLASAPIEIAW